MKLWVVTPVYFDVESFTTLEPAIRSAVAEIPEVEELVFVAVDDSAGQDPEIEDLAGRFPELIIVRPPYNLGHQRALVHGLRLIVPRIGDGDIVVTMDADGEDRPEDLPRLLAVCTDDRSVVIATRVGRKSSLAFTLLYALFKVAFQLLTGHVIRSGNYAAYRGKLARRLIYNPNFDLCYSSTLIALRLPTEPVPCHRGDRYAGSSKMSYSRLLVHGLRMLMPFMDRITIRALVTFFGIFLTALVASAVLVIIRLFTEAAIPGWASLGLLSLLMLSVVALGNVLLLFMLFAQSNSVRFDDLENVAIPETRETKLS